MSKNPKKKKKKEKVTYIDDGSTVADMSALDGGRRSMNLGEKGGIKEQWKTYTKAVRTMFIPMLVTMGAICLIFLILYLLFEFAA